MESYWTVLAQSDPLASTVSRKRFHGGWASANKNWAIPWIDEQTHFGWIGEFAVGPRNSNHIWNSCYGNFNELRWKIPTAKWMTQIRKQVKLIKKIKIKRNKMRSNRSSQRSTTSTIHPIFVINTIRVCQRLWISFNAWAWWLICFSIIFNKLLLIKFCFFPFTRNHHS